MAKVEKDINASEIIKRRKYNVAIRKDYQILLIRIIFWTVVGWFLFSQVFLLVRNTGMEMFPSLKDGDLLLTYRLENTYEKNDVITYQVNGNRYAGRIVALEKDIVQLDESGNLLVNGIMQNEEILYPTFPKEGGQYPYQVPKSCVYVLGDYRTKSQDSRDFGAIAVDDIESKVLTLLRRRGI